MNLDNVIKYLYQHRNSFKMLEECINKRNNNKLYKTDINLSN